MDNIVVNFVDHEWENFEPHFEIEYKGKKYRAIDIPVIRNGMDEIVRVSEFDLEESLFNGDFTATNVPAEAWAIDEHIAFYADPHQRIFDILANVYDIDKPQYSAMARNKAA